MAIHRLERDRFAAVLFYGIVLAVVYLAFQVIAPFLQPLGWAAVFAMLLAPLARRFERRLSGAAAATLTTLIATLLLVIPAVLVLTVLAREVVTLVREVQDEAYAAPARLQALWDALRGKVLIPLPEDLSGFIANAVRWLASRVAGMASSTLQNIVSFTFQLFVMLFCLFFFLRDRVRLVDVLRQILPFTAGRRDRLLSETYDLVVATVGSTFTVALAQGLLTGLALWVLGFRAPVFWGVITAALSVIPVLGSGIVWGPAAIYLIGSGHVGAGVGLVLFGVLVIGMADNVLRPILLSGRTSMHGLLVFISLMGGVGAFGFIGLIAGPVTLAALSTLAEAVMREPAETPAASPEAEAPLQAHAAAEPPAPQPPPADPAS